MLPFQLSPLDQFLCAPLVPHPLFVCSGDVRYIKISEAKSIDQPGKVANQIELETTKKTKSDQNRTSISLHRGAASMAFLRTSSVIPPLRDPELRFWSRPWLCSIRHRRIRSPDPFRQRRRRLPCCYYCSRSCCVPRRRSAARR